MSAVPSFKLVTVNTAPERAYRLIGRMVEGLKGRYQIQHVGNCERADEIPKTIEDIQPDVLFCASMWTAEQSSDIFSEARRIKPDIKTYAIPHGMQVEKGPDYVVQYLIENVPGLLDK